MDQYYNFIVSGEKEKIDEWLAQLDSAYAIGKSLVTDEVYDHLVRAYEQRFGKRTVVGAPPTHSSVNLPIAMMSLDKIMTEKELQTFMSKNPGPYVVMDKINGNSGLYEIKNGIARLYNRGDGTEGTDLTHILNHINLPKLPFDVLVKGELVINKKDYEPYRQDYRTNLSMVAGLLNSQSADPERLRLIRFIAFDMAFPSNQDIELNMSTTLKYLVQYGFHIPYNVVTPSITVEWLSRFLKQQQTKQPYEVDGMVIVADRKIKYSERLIRDNPKYAIAFKEYGDAYETTVIDVVWEASKHGVIKPVVHVVPVKVGDTGFTIRKSTGFNAKWICDNKVGPGAKILVTHNTIPYIVGVSQPTSPKMPPVDKYPEGSWKWNETGVDIFLLESNDEVKIAQIYEFFKNIGAKYWGETTLAKFYFGGYNTIKKMVETTKEEFYDSSIEGVGKGIIDRMIKTRDEAIPQASLAQLMAGSGSFGLGFGRRRSQAIINVYPNILSMTPTVEQIEEINGFAKKTAEQFVRGLPKFKQFIADIPILGQVARGELKPSLSLGQVSPSLPPLGQVSSPFPGSVSPLSQVSSPFPGAVSPLSQVSPFPAPLVAPLPGAVSPLSQVSPFPAPLVAPLSNKQPRDDIRGKSVVFTGFRNKNLESAIEAAGGFVKTGVSKKTSYVLVGGSKGKGSGKEKKAIQYGIPVLSVEEFKNKFGF